MQRNNTPILIGTILFGLLALGATLMLMFRGSSTPTVPTAGPTPTPTPSTHWLAKIDIPPRTAVTPDMLESGPVDGGKVPVGAIASISEVRDMITNTTIKKGDPVTTSSFTPRLRRLVDANIEVPTGKRAVAIWVDPDQTAAGLVDAGDHIDVVVTHKLTWDKGPNQFIVGAVGFTEGRTIARNLVVLAVDKSIKAPPPTPTPAPAAGPAGEGSGAPAVAPTAVPPPPPPGQAVRTRVVLAATPLEAADLVAGNAEGTLHITIRNPLDDDVAPVPAAREHPSDVITILPRTEKTPVAIQIKQAPWPGPKVPPMPPAPPPTKSVTVIRGTEKTLVITPQ